MPTKPASIGGWGYIGSYLASQIPPAPQNALQILFLDNGTGVPPYGNYQYSDGQNWVNFGSGGGGGGGVWGSIGGTLSAQADLTSAFLLKANLASPPLTGTPTAPTAAPNTNTTQVATTAYVDTAGLLKANAANAALTGVPTAPTASPNTNTTQLASTAYADALGALKANTASPVLNGTASGTLVLPSTFTMAATPSQSDNSLKVSTTAYVDTGLATRAIANPAAAISGSITLVQANHFNRHLSWTGTTGTLTVSATASAGDNLEVSNDGTGLLTFSGVSVPLGCKTTVEAGQLFQAVFTNGAWVSVTPRFAYLVPVTSISAAYTLAMADAGTTIYHPAADVTARTWTIDSNANVPMPIGSTVTFDNEVGAGIITIGIAADTLVLVGAAGSTGSRTLAAGGRAVAQKVLATRWRISGSAELT